MDRERLRRITDLEIALGSEIEAAISDLGRSDATELYAIAIDEEDPCTDGAALVVDELLSVKADLARAEDIVDEIEVAIELANTEEPADNPPAEE